MSTRKLIQRHDLLPLPDHLKVYFSDYKVCVVDAGCGEPVAWGYEPQTRLADDLFAEVGTKYGTWHCGPRRESMGSWLAGKTPTSISHWFLITKYLTLEEAIEKYGSEVCYERGPMGGFRSMTVGGRQFFHELLPGDFLKQERIREQERKGEERAFMDEFWAREVAGFSEEGKAQMQALLEKAAEFSDTECPVELRKRIGETFRHYSCLRDEGKP